MPKKIAKNTYNVGLSFTDRATFEAFQSASYLFFHNLCVGSLFWGHLVLLILPTNSLYLLCYNMVERYDNFNDQQRGILQ